MAIPPRSRFYAMLYTQFGGFILVGSGMAFYWLRFGDARVPATVTGRVIGIAVLLLAMGFLLFVGNSWRPMARGLAGKDLDSTEPLADNPDAVRRLVWSYCYIDLILLTYLVYVTGGITGSMYAGVYLTIPAVALLLVLDRSDLSRAARLITASLIGIALSFLMSHFRWYVFNSAQFEHAFDISLSLVTAEAIAIPVLQVAVLAYQLEKVDAAAAG